MPATPRDAARLMVVSRADRVVSEHVQVRDLARFLRKGDVLVFNTTRVLPARLVGKREDTGGAVEGLFLSGVRAASGEEWTVLLRAKKVRPGMRIVLEDAEGRASGVALTAIERDESEVGAWRVGVESQAETRSPASALEIAGHTPLPPYILKAREHGHVSVPEANDRDRYQTVYAKEEGSVAAPTAGLHFTPQLLQDLEAIGVERVDVTLHVGTGTFRPVEAEVVEEHPMHTERCTMGHAAASAIIWARAEGRRVIAVGTTSARTIESYAQAYEALLASGLSTEEAISKLPDSIDTRILITPGYGWKWVSGMLTNFHLPRSTLLAMVGSLLEHEGNCGVSDLIAIYEDAIRREYRFFSYGDAMLVV